MNPDVPGIHRTFIFGPHNEHPMDPTRTTSTTRRRQRTS